VVVVWVGGRAPTEPHEQPVTGHRAEQALLISESEDRH
jgi:hypothetical protein